MHYVYENSLFRKIFKGTLFEVLSRDCRKSNPQVLVYELSCITTTPWKLLKYDFVNDVKNNIILMDFFRTWFVTTWFYTDHCWTAIRLFLLYVYTFHSRYNTDWIANMEIGLDPSNSVI